MSVGYIFITASQADHKLVNHFLVDMRNWDYGEDDFFHIVQSRYGNEIEPKLPSSTEDITEAGSMTADNFEKNEWAGASLDEVLAFCDKADVGLYIVLDDEGVHNRTAVLVEKVEEWEDEDEDDGEPPSEDDEDEEEEKRGKPMYGHKKIRVNWQGIYMVWCNLDIANMDFEDFCEDDQGTDDGWFTPTELAQQGPEEGAKKRDAFFKELKEKGSI